MSTPSKLPKYDQRNKYTPKSYLDYSVEIASPNNKTIASTEKWYAVATNYRKEGLAIAHLANQGFKIFSPVFRKVKVRGTARRVEMSPLFPGYVFISFCLAHNRWQSVNGTFGVKGLVGPRGALPSPIPAAAMTSLLTRCPKGIWEPSPPTWCRGDKVEVLAGAFVGFPAKFHEMLSRDRVRVLLSWIDSEVPTVMPSGFIAAAS